MNEVKKCSNWTQFKTLIEGWTNSLLKPPKQEEQLITNNNLKIETDAFIKIIKIFKEMSLQNNFSNGRFVRNMIEKAKMKQMARLVRSELKNVTKDDCETLIADDFDEPANCKKDNNRQIGFAV